jgi:hypothetical protein
MVSGFPLDAMHTMYLLVCKHLLEFALEGCRRTYLIPNPTDPALTCKTTKQAVIDARLEICKSLTPAEFNRKVSPTQWASDWKAVEFRQFFLYLAYPIFEDVLETHVLELIASIQCFMYLIGGADPNPVPEDDLQLAQQIIEHFVSEFAQHTAGNGLKPCFHFMLHVVNDCREQKCHYDVLSVFKFENMIRAIKPRVRTGYAKLQQLRTTQIEIEKFVFNRNQVGVIERDEVGEPAYGWGGIRQNKSQKETFVYSTWGQVKTLRFKRFILSTNFKDSFCLVTTRSSGMSRVPQIFRCTNIQECCDSNTVTIIGHVYKKYEHVFRAPLPSRSRHVYLFSDESGSKVEFPIAAIVGKLYVTPSFKRIHVNKLLKREDLGENFERVTHWVGVAERHLMSANVSTLY